MSVGVVSVSKDEATQVSPDSQVLLTSCRAACLIAQANGDTLVFDDHQKRDVTTSQRCG